MLIKEVDEERFDLLWLENVVEILNKGVTEGVLMDDENKISRNFKIRQFYLSALLKFASSFNGKYFRGHTFVLNGILYLKSFQYETNISIARKEEINNLKLKYLEVLCCIYKSDEFFRILENYPFDVNELSSLLFICETISKVLITKESQKNLYGTILLKKVIQILIKSSKLSINERQYSELVETIAVLVMKNDDFQLCEKILFETFLDNNYMIGSFCNDVWAIILR